MDPDTPRQSLPKPGVSRQDETLLLILLEAMPEAMLLVDGQGRIVLVNQHAEELFGYHRDELLGQDIEVLVPVRFRPQHAQYLREAAAQAPSRPMEAELELHVVTKQGREFPVEISLGPYESPAGGLVLCAIRDASKRQRAEAELERRARQHRIVAELGLLEAHSLQALLSELHRLQEALEVDYVEVLELSPDGQELLLAAGAGWPEGHVGKARQGTQDRSLGGYTLNSQQPVIVRNYKDEPRFRMPPRLQEHEVASSMTVIIPGRDRPYGVLGVHATEERFFGEDDVNVLQTVANLLGQAIRRHEAEAALRELNEELERRVEARTRALRDSEERFAKAFHASPAPTVLIDLSELRILDANPSLLRLLERRRDELVDRGVYELDLLVETDRRPPFYDQLRRGEPASMSEVHLRTKTKGLRTVLMEAEPVEVESGPVALVTLVDITERKQTEKRLIQAIQATMQDTAWLSRSIMERFLQSGVPERGQETDASLLDLTRREREVLLYIARGWSNQRIADELGLKPQTVHNYTNRLYEKLQVRSRAEAIVWARRRGLLE